MIQVQLVVYTNGSKSHNLTLVSPEVGEHVWNHTHFFLKEECPARIIATKKGEDDVMTKYHVIIFFSQSYPTFCYHGPIPKIPQMQRVYYLFACIN